MEWIQFRSSLARSHLDFWEENISAIIADIVEEPRAGCACATVVATWHMDNAKEEEKKKQKKAAAAKHHLAKPRHP